MGVIRKNILIVKVEIEKLKVNKKMIKKGKKNREVVEVM